MYSVREGESVTAVVSVMSDEFTLDRDVVVIVITSNGTADSGIVYMPIHVQYMYSSGVHTCTMYIAIVLCIHIIIACKYNTVVYMCYSVYLYVPISLQLTSW